MVYDPDTVRAVLLNLQMIPAELEPVNLKKFYRCSVDGRTPGELSEHVRLMTEDRLIGSYKQATAKGWVWHPTRITLEGHRFLEAIKDEKTYSKTKKLAKKAFGFVSVESIKVAIPMVMKAMIDHIGK